MLTPYILVIVNILRKTVLQTRGGPWFYFFHHQDKGWKVGGGPGEQSRVNNDLNQFDTFSLLFHLEALRGALFSFDLLRSTWAPASSTHQCSYATLPIENTLSIQYCKNHQLGPKKKRCLPQPRCSVTFLVAQAPLIFFWRGCVRSLIMWRHH